MRKYNYSMQFTWIIIIILTFILIWLIINKSKNKLPSKESITINNNIVFPVEKPKLDYKEINFSWDLIEEDDILIDDINSNSWDLFKEKENTIIENVSSDSLELIKKEEDNKKNLEEKKVIEIINTAWETWKSDLCNDIMNETEKTKCLDNSYATKSSIEKNVDLCYKISDIELKNSCLDNYYNNTALKASDYNICSKIINTNLRDNCNYSIILNKIESRDLNKWIKICDILNWEYKTYCKEKYTSQKDWELLQKAINANDIKLCDNITMDTEKNKCEDVINLKIALSTKDINKCLEINEDILKSQCNDTLVNINK